MNITKELAVKFKEFVNSQDYDPYEVAILCGQVLEENGIRNSSSPLLIGIRLFDEE